MKTTALGRFGESLLSFVASEELATFVAICARVEGAAGVRDLGADAGDRFGDAHVGMVVSMMEDSTRDDDDDLGENQVWPMFIGFFISDRESDDMSGFPPTGPTGADVHEVDFTQLLGAVADALPGRYSFQYRCHLAVSPDNAELAFPLPVSFWRSNPPFGSLIGARFELDVRGVKDGWMALDSGDDEITAMLGFTRNTELSIASLERAWDVIRRIYDKTLIPDDQREGGTA